MSERPTKKEKRENICFDKGRGILSLCLVYLRSKNLANLLKNI